MTTGLPALRALIVYALCVPLALLVGYLLANPLDWSSIGFFTVLLLVVCAPLFLKWHHAILIATVNSAAVALLPGHPSFCSVMAAISLGISILQLTLSRRFRFLYVPVISRPLVFLLVVVLATAKLTGGIGFHLLGGGNIGGKRYIDVIAAILAYFALAARRIPPHKAALYTSLFFFGGVTAMVGSLSHFVPPGLYFIFMFFPPEALPGMSDSSGGFARLGGVAFGCFALICWLLARYGLRGVLAGGRPWRSLIFGASIILSLLGGFRVVVITIILALTLEAYLEGLFKSRLMPILVLAGTLAVTMLVPFVSKLPFNFQRSLAVLPVAVAPEVRESAKTSSDWRVEMWHEVIPQIPRYLLLGKGYAINFEEWSAANASTGLQSQSAAIVSGDYHNGPLSVIIPFGIWGVIAFSWVLLAGGRLLYFNRKYGDPALHQVNTFLLALFITQVIIFLFVFGGFNSGLIKFTGLFGFSVALNGGMRRPAPAQARQPIRIRPRMPLKPAPGFSRR